MASPRSAPVRPPRAGSGRPAALALVLALLVACSVPVQLAGNVQRGRAPDGSPALLARDNFFEPEDMELAAGDEVTVEIRNEGNRPHDWTVDDLGLSTGVMSPGEVLYATFTVPQDTVEFVCTLHPGMDGELRVE